jgi:hypothetical protein
MRPDEKSSGSLALLIEYGYNNSGANLDRTPNDVNEYHRGTAWKLLDGSGA